LGDVAAAKLSIASNQIFNDLRTAADDPRGKIDSMPASKAVLGAVRCVRGALGYAPVTGAQHPDSLLHPGNR